MAALPYSLLASTQQDVSAALDTAIERVLGRAEFRAQTAAAGMSADAIKLELEPERGVMLAAAAPEVNRVERARRAQERLTSRSTGRQDRPGWIPDWAAAPIEQAQQAPEKIRKKVPGWQGLIGDRGSEGDGQAGSGSGGAAHPSRMLREVNEKLDQQTAQLVRALEHRVVAPQVRRLLNRHRMNQLEREQLFATELVELDVRGLRAKVEEERLVRTRSLEELGRMLVHLPRGSVGVAGSRGVGKSTALENVEHVLPQDSGMAPPFRVSVPAPTEYVAHDFLMHLLGEIADTWLDRPEAPDEPGSEQSVRTRTLALTVTAALPAALFVVGGWLLASYVAATRLATPGASMAVVVALASVLVAGFLGRQAGLRLHQTWSVMRAAERQQGATAEDLDEFAHLRLTTRTSRVFMLTGTFMAVGAAAVLWLDAYPFSGDWSAAQLASLLLMVVAAVGLVGALTLLDFGLLRTESPAGTMVGVVTGATALAVVLQGAGTWLLPDFDVDASVVVGAALTAAALCCLTLRLGIRGADEEDQRSPADELALQVRRRLQFQRSSATGTSTGVKLGASAYLPFETSRGVTRSVTETESALTVPKTVKLIRDLLAKIHAELQNRAGEGLTVKIVVAIDEMDKLEASDRARDFLNEIKGVFGVDGVVFLVSVSEDAMASFERRGMAFRDAFDSAFDEVVHLPQMSFRETRDVLQAKVTPEMPLPFVALGHCLAGGLARDVNRTVHHMTDETPDGSLAAIATAAVHRELRGKWNGVVSAIRSLPLEPQATDLILVMYRLDRCPDHGQVDARCLIRASAFEEIAAMRMRPTKDADLPELRTLLRLAGEYVGFVYFCRTLVDFFGAADGLADRLTRAMEDDQHQRHTLDYLARARHHLAVKPRLGWEAISFFRQAHGLTPVLNYPEVLLGPAVDEPVTLSAPDSPAGLEHSLPSPRTK